MYTVMTVCTGNICRSPMAEIILRTEFERRGLADGLGGAHGDAIKLGDALGDGIGVIVEFGPHGIEHFVDGDEGRALEVPVRLLGHEAQIDRLGEAGVEQIDHRGLGVGLEADFWRFHLVCPFGVT